MGGGGGGEASAVILSYGTAAAVGHGGVGLGFRRLVGLSLASVKTGAHLIRNPNKSGSVALSSPFSVHLRFPAVYFTTKYSTSTS